MAVTTLQMGTYTPSTDSFATVLDLNDRVTYFTQALQISPPEKTYARGANIRTRGEQIARWQYKNRMLVVHLFLYGATAQGISNALHGTGGVTTGFYAALEQPPYSLKIQVAGGSTPTYWTVLAVQEVVPYDAKRWQSGYALGIELHLELYPTGFTIPRQVLQNLVMNPGFEAPFGGGLAQSAPIAFADPLTTFHAYGDPGYQAAVLQDAPLRYYPMDELAGTVCDDLGSTATNGTYTGGVTLGVSPGAGGGGDTAVTLNGTSGYITSATTGLPSGNAAVTVEAWLKLASAYTAGTNAILADLGATGSGNHWQLGLTATTGKPFFSNGGTGVATAGSALSTSTWHHLVGSWDGTTATLYVDGSSAATVAPGAMTVGTTAYIIGASQSITAFLPATVDDAAVYGSTLSAARVLAHFNAASAANQPILAPPNLYPDAVLANGGASLLRYYRLDEASGTSAFDIAGTGQTGTTHGSPTQGVAGLLAVDTDKAYSFAAASSQYVSTTGNNLPSANGAWSVAVLFQIAANPGANSTLCGLGGNTAHTGANVYVDTTGKVNCDQVGGTGLVTSTSAVSTGARHMAVVTWDGTTYRLYVDGSATGTPTTPGAMSQPSSGGAFNIGANTAAAAFFTGIIDEPILVGAALSSTQVTNLWNAANSGTPGTLANAMLIPAATQLAFGSPAWGAIQTWQLRFRYTTSLTLNAFLHAPSPGNYLLAQVFSGTNGLGLFQNIAGTVHTLAQATTPALTFEAWYWLQVTQFPSVSGNLPYLTLTLSYDTDGAVGAQLATVSAATFDAVTALSGVAALSAGGAAAVIGGQGNSAGAGQQVALFGPGGWIGSPAMGTVPAALAWEQSTANTATLGATNSGNLGLVQVPVTSYGAARIDAPPTGAWTGVWQSGNFASLTTLQQSALPVAAGGDTLAISGMVKATGNGSGYRVYAQINEYTAAGAFVTSNQNTIASGAGAVPWQAWNWSYTTQATTAFVVLILVAIDGTSSSASSTTWFDNVLVWDKTAAAQNGMPYCELRFPISPAQLLVSGIQGDMIADAIVEAGYYCASFPQNTIITTYLGRRAQSTQNGVLVSPGWTYEPPFTTDVLDASSYGGRYLATSIGSSDIQNLSTQPGGAAGIPAMADIAGTYHVFSRLWTADATPTSVEVSAYADVELGNQMASLSRTDLITRVQGTLVFPFTAGSTWTLVDAGQVRSPPAGLSTLTDPTKTYGRLFTGITGSSVTRYAFRSGFNALLPVDGNVMIVRLINPAGANYAVTNQWLYHYADAGTASNTFSVESGPLPGPAHAGGTPGTTSSVALNVNPGADVGTQLDPTPANAQIGGAGSGGAIVNQLALLAFDSNANMLAAAVDMAYTPRYLYPRG